MVAAHSGRRAPRVRATIDGETLVFRLPSRAEAEDYFDAAERGGSSRLDLGLDLCGACVVSGDFATVAEARPLAIVQQVLPAMLDALRARMGAERRTAIARWRRSETDLARMADNIVALIDWARAPHGTPAPEAAYAGALSVAEAVDAVRGTFRLVHGLIKGLGRRK